MKNAIYTLEHVGTMLKYVTDNPKKVGLIFLTGALIAAYLHRNSRNGKTAVTIATMIILGLLLLFS